MFAPLYHAAWQRGIAPTELDRCLLYVVRWMLQGVKDPNAPETPEDLFDAHLEREEWISSGKDPDDFYEYDDRALKQ